MKVLHVLNGSVPLVAGYASRAKYIVGSQRQINIEPFIVTSVRQGQLPYDVEEIDGVQYFRTNWSKSALSFLKGKAILGLFAEMELLYKRIVAVIKTVGPDIIHAHSPVICAFPAFLASRQYGLPFVYEIRALWEDAAVDSGSTKENSPRYFLTRFLETKLAKLADRLIVICDGLKTELGSRGIPTNKIDVVRNGVDSDIFRPLEKDDELMEKFSFRGKTIIGYIGTLYRFEGVHYIIKALERLCSEYDNIAGIIVGGGECEQDLLDYAKHSHLGERLIITGNVPHNEVKSYYSLIDICVYPRESRRITELVTPLKPLEAMSMGKVVLASDVGGLKELVLDGENGFLFKKDNLNDLISKLLMIMNGLNNKNDVGSKAREWVVRERNWLNICKRYLGIYESVMRLR